jgi:hypothetical protein
MTVRTSPHLSLVRHPITRISTLLTTYAQSPTLEWYSILAPHLLMPVRVL